MTLQFKSLVPRKSDFRIMRKGNGSKLDLPFEVKTCQVVKLIPMQTSASLLRSNTSKV